MLVRLEACYLWSGRERIPFEFIKSENFSLYFARDLGRDLGVPVLLWKGIVTPYQSGPPHIIVGPSILQQRYIWYMVVIYS